jgi:hypothetical protein
MQVPAAIPVASTPVDQAAQVQEVIDTVVHKAYYLAATILKNRSLITLHLEQVTEVTETFHKGERVLFQKMVEQTQKRVAQVVQKKSETFGNIPEDYLKLTTRYSLCRYIKETACDIQKIMPNYFDN